MARSFNGGAGDFVDCGAFQMPQAAFSVASWVFPTNITSNGIFVAVYDGTNAYCQFAVLASGSGFGRIMQDANNFIGRATNVSTIVLNAWQHVGFTWSGGTTNASIVFYYNGVASDTADSGGGTFTSAYSGSTVNFRIGTQFFSGAPNASYTGSEADVAFWNVALTAAEMLALAKGARPYTVRPLSRRGDFPLFGLSSPEPDLSGFVHNGTLTGTAKASGPPTTMFTPRWPQMLSPPAFLMGIGVGSYAVNAGWPSAGLQHRWPLDTVDNVGGVNADLVGGDNATEAGTVTSAAGPTGTPNAARSFDGLTGSAAFASSPLPASGAYTVSLWAVTPNINAGSTTGTAQTLINLGTSTTNTQTLRMAIDNGTVNGTVGGFAWNSAAISSLETGGAVFSNNAWTQVAVTFDGAVTYQGVVNGAVVGSVAASLNPPTANDTLGAKTSTSSFFDGSIAQLMIFNRALSASELAALYKYPTGIGETLSLIKASKIVANAGSYSLTGENVKLLKTSLFHAATAVYSLNGQNVVLAVGHKIGISVGLYAFTGETVHTYFGHAITPQAGTYLVVGNNETLTATRKILLQSGFVQVAGESLKITAAFPSPPFVPPSPPKLLGLEAISNLFGSM